MKVKVKKVKKCSNESKKEVILKLPEVPEPKYIIETITGLKEV